MSDMKHIVLLGDSVFYNKAYVNGVLDVISQVRLQIPDGWRASLRAVDGSVIENARKQALDLPDDAVHTENSGRRAGDFQRRDNQAGVSGGSSAYRSAACVRRGFGLRQRDRAVGKGRLEDCECDRAPGQRT